MANTSNVSSRTSTDSKEATLFDSQKLEVVRLGEPAKGFPIGIIAAIIIIGVAIIGLAVFVNRYSTPTTDQRKKTVMVLTDGTIVTIEEDGTKISEYPDHSALIKLTDDTIIKEETDGTMEITNVDKSTLVQKPDGTIIVGDIIKGIQSIIGTDGSVTVIQGSTATRTRQDGLVFTTKRFDMQDLQTPDPELIARLPMQWRWVGSSSEASYVYWTEKNKALYYQPLKVTTGWVGNTFTKCNITLSFLAPIVLKYFVYGIPLLFSDEVYTFLSKTRSKSTSITSLVVAPYIIDFQLSIPPDSFYMPKAVILQGIFYDSRRVPVPGAVPEDVLNQSLLLDPLVFVLAVKINALV